MYALWSWSLGSKYSSKLNLKRRMTMASAQRHELKRLLPWRKQIHYFRRLQTLWRHTSPNWKTTKDFSCMACTSKQVAVLAQLPNRPSLTSKAGQNGQSYPRYAQTAAPGLLKLKVLTRVSVQVCVEQQRSSKQGGC